MLQGGGARRGLAPQSCFGSGSKQEVIHAPGPAVARIRGSGAQAAGPSASTWPNSTGHSSASSGVTRAAA